MLKINLKGVNLDKFIKRESKIQKLYNLDRKSHTEIEFYVKRKKIKNFVARCDKMCYNVSIKEYTGIDFYLNFFKNHIGFILSTFFCVALLIISSQYIFKIDIYGLETINKNEFYEALNSNGIFEGSLKKENYSFLEDNLKEKFDSISQISIASKGNYIIINLKEKIPSFIIEESFDIVASCDGVIENISVIQGTKIKNEGDSFKKGDILVKGEFVNFEGEKINCKAVANITYIECISKTTHFKENQLVAKRTGNTQNITSLQLFDLTNKNYNVNFDNYEIEENIFYGFKNFILPFEIKYLTFYEIIYENKKIDFESVKNDLILENESCLKNENLDKNIKNVYSNTIKTDEGYIIVSTIEIYHII